VPGSHVLSSDDTAHVRWRRVALRERVGKGATVRAWGVADGFGELTTILFLVDCDLCNHARTGYDMDELVTWWGRHYTNHGVGDG
jgi:hypothetical protein